jgi:Zn-dependent protease
MGSPPGQIAVWAACLLVSILFHEFGHAVLYRSLGAQTFVILYGMGGLTFGRRDKPFSTLESVGVSLAGPIFGLVLGGLVWGATAIWGMPPTVMGVVVVKNLIWINVIWGLVNLLPMLPLDGGHVMEALLVAASPEKGRIWARQATVGVCVIFGVLCAMWGQSWPMILAVMFGMQAVQGLMVLRAQEKGQTPSPVPAPPAESQDVLENVTRMHKLLDEDRTSEARAVAYQVLDRAQAVGPRDAALRVLAWVSIGEGKPADALGFLTKTSPRFDDPFTWGTAIAASGDAAKALPHLSQAFSRMPTPSVVATYGRCLLAVGQRDEALALAPPESPVELQRALAEALLRSRDFVGALTVSDRLFARTHAEVDAYNAACALSRSGEVEQALQRLDAAITAGFKDLTHLEADPDLVTVRQAGGYAALRERLAA